MTHLPLCFTVEEMHLLLYFSVDFQKTPLWRITMQLIIQCDSSHTTFHILPKTSIWLFNVFSKTAMAF